MSSVERRSERWTVFLVTYPADRGGWRGYLSFRPGGGTGLDEVRTADLWIEESEDGAEARAGALTPALVASLLESAIQVDLRRRGPATDLRLGLRQLLVRHAASLLPGRVPSASELADPDLRSLYASYRIDQVARFLSLLPESRVRELVERTENPRLDLASPAALELAMRVVGELEGLLPLPPYDSWVEDFRRHREEHHRYAAEVRREARRT